MIQEKTSKPQSGAVVRSLPVLADMSVHMYAQIRKNQGCGGGFCCLLTRAVALEEQGGPYGH